MGWPPVMVIAGRHYKMQMSVKYRLAFFLNCSNKFRGQNERHEYFDVLIMFARNLLSALKVLSVKSIPSWQVSKFQRLALAFPSGFTR